MEKKEIVIPKHKHLIISARANKLFYEEDMYDNWIKSLVQFLGMNILIEPRTVYLSDVGNAGYTTICALSTSSITMHNWVEPKPHRIELDIYSCKDFYLSEVLEKIQKDFDCEKVYYKFINREEGFKQMANGMLNKEYENEQK